MISIKSKTAERSEERFSRNAETDLVCRLLLEKKKRTTGCHRPAYDKEISRTFAKNAFRLPPYCRTWFSHRCLSFRPRSGGSFIFFFNDTATTEIYTLSLHDALPIWMGRGRAPHDGDESAAGLELAAQRI